MVGLKINMLVGFCADICNAPQYLPSVNFLYVAFHPFFFTLSYEGKNGSTHARYNNEIRFSVTVLYSDKNQFISPPFFGFFSFLP